MTQRKKRNYDIPAKTSLPPLRIQIQIKKQRWNVQTNGTEQPHTMETQFAPAVKRPVGKKRGRKSGQEPWLTLLRLVAHPTEALQINSRLADNKAEDNLKK